MSYAIGIGVGMSILTFVFAYLTINLVNEYRFVRLFFLSMCCWTMTFTIGTMVEIANINTLTTLEEMLTTMQILMTAVSTLIFMLMFIFGLMSAFNIWRGRSLDDDFDGEDRKDRVFG